MGRIVDWISKLFQKKLIRFFLVAGLNTAFGYAVYAFFLWIDLDYKLAALLGQIIGVLFNFKTYGLLVFKNKNNRLIFRFVMVYLITYLTNIGSIYLLKKYAGLNDYTAALVMTVPIGLLGFVLNKFLVFEPRRPDKK